MEMNPVSKQFQDDLLLYSQTEEPEERRRIEKSLWSSYGAEYAVIVLDVSAFSLLTRRKTEISF